MMTKKFIWSLPLWLVLAVLTACGNDDPDPKPEPDNSTAELVDVINGTWISFGEDGLDWNMWTFGSSQKGIDALEKESSYIWFSSPDPCHPHKFFVTAGSYAVSGSVVSLLNESDKTNVSLTARNVHENMFDFTLSSDKKTVRKSNRVMDIVFMEPGTSFLVNMSDLPESLNVKDIVSQSPDILRIDESTKRVYVTGSGVGYIEIMTDGVSVYTVVVGSPITSMPYPFYEYVGKEIRKDVEGVDPEIAPLYAKYEGISKISTEGVDFTSKKKIESVSIEFNDNISPLAIYMILHKECDFIGYSEDKAHTRIYRVNTDDGRDIRCAWTTNLNKIVFY